jgi:hypothetical protein
MFTKENKKDDETGSITVFVLAKERDVNHIAEICFS